jgi:imidazolonepropionase-like amidohydrolase
VRQVVQVLHAVQAGVDSIEHGTEIDKENLAQMAKKGVFLVPTSAAHSADYESAPAAQRVAVEPAMQALRAEIANAQAAHIRIVSGFDAATEDRQGRNALELASLVKFGLTPIEAIRAASTAAAEPMG